VEIARVLASRSGWEGRLTRGLYRFCRLLIEARRVSEGGPRDREAESLYPASLGFPSLMHRASIAGLPKNGFP
jgi:hypothetical protein